MKDAISSEVRRNLQAEAGICSLLAMHGIFVRRLQDLLLELNVLRKAWPILLEQLPRTENLAARTEIVRVMAVPALKPFPCNRLVEEYLAQPINGGRDYDLYKWSIGNAIESLTDGAAFKRDPALLPALLSIAGDRRHGQTREVIITALGRAKTPEAVVCLDEVIDDPDPWIHHKAVIALRKLKTVEALAVLRRRSNVKDDALRKAIQDAIEATEKYFTRIGRDVPRNVDHTPGAE